MRTPLIQATQALSLALVLLALGSGRLGADSTPPPALFSDAERVLFQGDSITDMGRGRTEDPNHILGHGYVFLIAARHGAAYAERAPVFINRGVSGNTVADMAKRWKTDALDLKPDVLSVLIGINDIDFAYHAGTEPDYARIEAQYDNLLAQARAQNPALKLILGEPFMLAGAHNEKDPAFWKQAVARMQAVVEELGAKYHAPVVHYQKVFDEALSRAPVSAWIWDGIHPTYAGHQLMADEWQRCFEAYFQTVPWAAGDNTALIPKPKIEQDIYDWYQRHFEVLELGKRLHPDIVLVGDSITHFWGGEPVAERRNGPNAWDLIFKDKKVLNLGFGWDRTQNVLWRLDHGEFDGVSPRVVVLNIGTNNLTGSEHARTNSPAEIAEAIRAICFKLHQKSPRSRIVVMGVFPRGFEPDNPLRQKIRELNALLPGVLKDSDSVVFLDIGQRFLEPGGGLSREIMSDSVHPTDKGYQIWARALRETGLFQ